MSRDDTAMTQGLTAFLQGYGKHDVDGLAAIARYSAWSALAARENERRMARIIESLPLDEVQALPGRKSTSTTRPPGAGGFGHGMRPWPW